MKKLMTLVFVLLMAGCMQPPQSDLEGLKTMLGVSQSSFDAKDPAAIAATYAEDGVVMSPNSDLPLSVSGPESENDQETLHQRLGGYDVVAIFAGLKEDIVEQHER